MENQTFTIMIVFPQYALVLIAMVSAS